MNALKIRKIQRQCFVPGCGHTSSFICSRNMECRATTVLCTECIRDIFAAVYPEEYKRAFGHHVSEKTSEEVPDNTELPEERKPSGGKSKKV